MTKWAKQMGKEINKAPFFTEQTIKDMVTLNVNLGEAVPTYASAQRGLSILTCHPKMAHEVEIIMDDEEAQRITAHGGLYRQKQYIGKLMRNFDVDPIEAALTARRDSRDTASRAFHRLEQWRDRLLIEGDAAIEALRTDLPHADLEHVRRLVAEAARETTAGRPPTAARALFRYLRELPFNA